MYILDTDICIYTLNGRNRAVVDRLRAGPAAAIGTTAITVAELRHGALRSGRRDVNLARLQTFLAPLMILPFDEAAAQHFAEIKQDLAGRGQLIGPMDLLIASVVRANADILVTNNVREFSRVPGLRLENWT